MFSHDLQTSKVSRMEVDNIHDVLMRNLNATLSQLQQMVQGEKTAEEADRLRKIQVKVWRVTFMIIKLDALAFFIKFNIYETLYII